MRPPLVGPDAHGTALSFLGRTRSHVFGCLSALSRDEAEGIETWLSKVERQVKQPPPFNWDLREFCKLQYIVSPPLTDWKKDEVTGTPRYRRFSCAGFVIACYDEGADILLLDWQAENFPTVDLKTINAAYGDIVGECSAEDRAWFGIADTTPWPKPIVLAGYILHSLRRSDEAIRTAPYVPRDNEEGRFS
jgi:hypothetical protein